MHSTVEGVGTAGLFADRYRIAGLLGQGGGARVLRAVDLRLGREVALKVLHQGASEDFTRRFAAEARTLARLRHRGLVEVYDYGRADDRPYLVLELVDGPTLADALRASALSVPATVRLGRELARTLAFVHACGVVHRDVKPSNVLIDASGAPRLADFGIARSPVDADAADADATRTGFVVGTPAYLAPEQIRGEGARPAADVYALGLLLIECLTGQRVYPGGPIEAAVARLLHAPSIPDGIPARLARALRAMTRPDPAARPSAEECVELLDPGKPAPPPAGVRSGGRSELRRRLALSAGTACLLLVGGAGSVAFGASDGTEPSARLQPAAATVTIPVPPAPTTPAAEPAAAPAAVPAPAPAADRAPARPAVRTEPPQAPHDNGRKKEGKGPKPPRRGRG
ncbi:serine/threonine protein kinase [Kitasatospora sp. NA04385]|uniref:serine/threonine-protein kinase n=1 Tax=Kitasatospora sp. NA04385 TaxID=2742135 RepID=UPI0015925656|nr:serine/threonine-protein kinase [Kitasatospora sp. NA04385]QKW20256.1 serine/threonine protein kinase [Kitasatospora sp. NA04385]